MYSPGFLSNLEVFWRCRDPGLSRAELTGDKCLNWIRKELFEVWSIVQCFCRICRCFEDGGIQGYCVCI